MLSVRSSILKKIEAQNNKKVIKTLVISELAMFVIWFLNLVGVFVHPQWQMNTGLIVISAVVILAVYLIKKSNISNSVAKYIVTMTMLVFVIVITVLLSYHAFIVFCFPMLVACMYYDRKLLRITAILSIFTFSIAIVLGQFYAGYPDLNFSGWNALILFSIVPKILCLWAIYGIIDMICVSIITMLGDLMTSEEQKELIQKNAEIKETAGDVSTELVASVASLERIIKILFRSNKNISEKSSEVYNNTEENISDINEANDRMQVIVKSIDELDNNIDGIVKQVKNGSRDDNKEVVEKIESLYGITKEISSNGKAIDEHIGNIKDSMNDNFKIVEDVSVITQESSESTEFLVDMVVSIRELSEQLDSVVK